MVILLQEALLKLLDRTHYRVPAHSKDHTTQMADRPCCKPAVNDGVSTQVDEDEIWQSDYHCHSLPSYSVTWHMTDHEIHVRALRHKHTSYTSYTTQGSHRLVTRWRWNLAVWLPLPLIAFLQWHMTDHEIHVKSIETQAHILHLLHYTGLTQACNKITMKSGSLTTTATHCLPTVSHDWPWNTCQSIETQAHILHLLHYTKLTQVCNKMTMKSGSLTTTATHQKTKKKMVEGTTEWVDLSKV